MAKFSVGDRVNVYEGPRARKATVDYTPDDSPSYPGAVYVRFDNPNGPRPLNSVHEKQCRRLKPRKPKVEMSLSTAFEAPAVVWCGSTKMLPVPEGSRVISKADLEKAWDSREPQEFFLCSRFSPGFKALCKALGFESEGK